MQLLSIRWNVNPEIFHIQIFDFGTIHLRWYGFLFALAFIFGYLIFQRFFKKENLSQELLDKLTVYMALGTIIGARLGHVLFYDPGYYFSHPLEIIAVWHGGLASHGAAIGILIALYLFVRKYNFNYLWLLDRIAIVIALSGVFIRTGNLMNSEIYGSVTNLPWGFIFVRDGQNEPRHPTQIYEALSYLIIFILLYTLYNKGKMINDRGKLFAIFLVLLFGARFMIEFIKNPQEDFEKNLPLDMGQFLSIPFIIIGIGLFIYASKSKKGLDSKSH